ncbi:hypothetical protein YC2023_036286 [Brassica napus]
MVKPGSIKDTDLTSGWEVQPTDRLSPGYSNGLKCNSPYPYSLTVSGKSRGDSVAVSGVEGKKRETRGLGRNSKWWLTAAELRSLKTTWFCY